MTITETAVGYVRVSSEEQSMLGVSLDAQEARVRAYAEMRGLQLLAIFREEGVSAKVPLSKRPQGARLVAALAKGNAKHVIAVKLDRLFRNAADALQQSAEWDKAKRVLNVIDMGGSTIDTASAIGRMFFTMAAAFAEMERNLISERTKSALSFKKSHSKVYTRILPLGYDCSDGQLVPNIEEMRTVATIRGMRAEGLSLQRIATALNDSNTPTKLGGKWHAVTIQKVLRAQNGLQSASGGAA